MVTAREAYDWSADKLRNDPLTFVLAVYMLGVILAFAICPFMYWGQPVLSSMLKLPVDALIWPLTLGHFLLGY